MWEVLTFDAMFDCTWNQWKLPEQLCFLEMYLCTDLCLNSRGHFYVTRRIGKSFQTTCESPQTKVAASFVVKMIQDVGLREQLLWSGSQKWIISNHSWLGPAPWNLIHVPVCQQAEHLLQRRGSLYLSHAGFCYLHNSTVSFLFTLWY